MVLSTTHTVEQLCLRPFDPRYATVIAQWVKTEEELRWLAPSTQGPLTAAKVTGWIKSGGVAIVLIGEGDTPPIGYGELNPMHGETDHVWLGHVVIHPDHRGRATGQAFVRALLDHAFTRFSAKRVSLIVFPDNTAALRCYRRVGFRHVGEECHRFGDTGPKHRLLRLEISLPCDR